MRGRTEALGNRAFPGPLVRFLEQEPFRVPYIAGASTHLLSGCVVSATKNAQSPGRTG